MSIYKAGDKVIREKDGKVYVVTNEPFALDHAKVICKSLEPDGSRIRVFDVGELEPAPDKTPL